MKKGIRGHDVDAVGLENICNRCREMGCDYIQLVLERSIEGFQYGMFSEEFANSIKEQLGGLKIAVFGSYIDPSDRNEESLKHSLDRFKEKIKYASILKPTVVGTETGVYYDDNGDASNDTEEAYQHLLKNIGELLEEAEKYGVSIGVEGVHFFVINTPEKMARLIKDLNSPNAKVIFDPVNYININNYQEQDRIIETAFRLLADKLVAIHAKDFLVVDGEMKSVLPGEGMLNYKLIFELLKKYNLDIPFISEGAMDVDAEKAFENLQHIETI